MLYPGVLCAGGVPWCIMGLGISIVPFLYFVEYVEFEGGSMTSSQSGPHNQSPTDCHKLVSRPERHGAGHDGLIILISLDMCSVLIC